MGFFGKKKEGITEYIERTAKSNPKKIVYPESEDERILKAAEIVSKKKSAEVILLGNTEEINQRAKALKLKLEKVSIIDFEKSEKAADYAKKLYELRKHKGMTPAEANELMKNSRYFGTMMVYFGDADGLVSGASHSTADTLKPALQIIKTKEDTKYASSFFIMVKEEQVFFFADCAFIQNPNVEELTSIAIQTAESVKKFGYEPRIAMLSFSTKGSAEGPILEKVRKATAEVKKQRTDLVIDGELQLDAAIIPEVAKKKCPDSPIQGNANVLVFPDLNAGNIGYKLVERFGHTHAIGPIVQGLKRPINDLSRGCSVEDIVLTTEVTVLEAQSVALAGEITQVSAQPPELKVPVPPPKIESGESKSNSEPETLSMPEPPVNEEVASAIKAELNTKKEKTNAPAQKKKSAPKTKLSVQKKKAPVKQAGKIKKGKAPASKKKQKAKRK